MKAILFYNPGDQSVQLIPLPELRPTYLLIKVDSVALNPTDWKHISFGRGSSPFSILGCDYAGTVVSIGAEFNKSFKIGDKVYGCVHGGNYNEPYDGAFAEYAAVKDDVTTHEPTSHGSGLSMEGVCTVALDCITARQGLFQPGKALALALPERGKEDGKWLLISGGSTAAGALGIQFAKLAGYKVITTCSPRNNDLVKSRSADVVFDYNDTGYGAKIRKLTENKLRYGWDLVGEPESLNACGEALSSDSTICHFASITTDESPREGVKGKLTWIYTMFGEGFPKYEVEFPASKEDFDHGKMWIDLTEMLVAEGKVKPYPKRVSVSKSRVE
jgi:NADPH:quinone reductase-like Zn-dependent oxidoreductase